MMPSLEPGAVRTFSLELFVGNARGLRDRCFRERVRFGEIGVENTEVTRLSPDACTAKEADS